MLLSYISMSYKNKTDDSWVYRTMRKYKWNRQTDRQTYSKLHVIQIKADRLRYMYIKTCYSFHQKGYWNVQVYKKTAATSKHF